MDWLTVTILGACGGAIVQVVALSADIQTWHHARRLALTSREQKPALIAYVDLPAEALVFLTRLALGALAGLLFHNQVSGTTAAIAVGASAPALLRQFGAARSAAGLISQDGTQPQHAASKEAPDQGPTLAEGG
jgi:hypothetical protein